MSRIAKLMTCCASAVALVVLQAGGLARAENYPTKPVHFIVPQSPGGQTDVQARIISKHLTKLLGQPVIVENHPGAGGQIGFDLAVKAPADGYTLVLGSISTLAIIPNMPGKNAGYKTDDFSPVAFISKSPYVLVVNARSPVKSVAELVALAKSKPHKITFGSSGFGTGIHLTTELFQQMAGIDLVHVAYKGSAPATIDLLGGRVVMIFDNMITALPHIRSGKLRALAVTTEKRNSLLRNVPTIQDSGYPGFESGSWQGIVVRKGTPEPVIALLNQQIDKVLEMPEVKKAIESQGNQMSPGSPADFAKFIASESDKWSKVMKKSNIRAN